MKLTPSEFNDLYAGALLAKVEEKETRIELAKMTSYAQNVKKQQWRDAFGNPDNTRIVIFGGEDLLEEEQVSEAKVNEKLTELINQKPRTSMDNFEAQYLQKHSEAINRKE